MIRQLHEPTASPEEIHPGLVEHQDQMIRRCPYLGPSVQRGLTTWCAYQAESGDERALLVLLSAHAEEIRQARRAQGPLVCRNVALFGPRTAQAAQALMEWPVWLARNVYAPVQIIVDRFWIGIGRLPERGRSVMPSVPVSYFMIRCGIAHRDRVIVSARTAEQMAALNEGPGDDGRDVFVAQLGYALDEQVSTWTALMAAFPAPSPAQA